jgi:hypothetical protein
VDDNLEDPEAGSWLASGSDTDGTNFLGQGVGDGGADMSSESESESLPNMWDADDEYSVWGGLGTRSRQFAHGVICIGAPLLSNIGDLFWGGVFGLVKFRIVGAENTNWKPLLLVSKLYKLLKISSVAWRWEN